MSENESETWEDWEEESGPVLSIFGRKEFKTGAEAIEYDKLYFGFDINHIRQQLCLDYYGLVKLINWAREKVGESENISKEIGKQLQRQLLANNDLLEDKYLKPSMSNDNLLFNLDELAFEDPDEEKVIDKTAERVHKICFVPSPIEEVVESTKTDAPR